MALAEARAAWQRTANRCLVQEDAKRAPKLVGCSPVPPSAKQAETGPTNAAGGQDIPSSNSLPFNRNPSYSNLSPNTRWWLQLQPNYGYQKGLMDEQFTSPEGNNDTRQIQRSSGDVMTNENDSGLVEQTSPFGSPFDDQCRNFITCEKRDTTLKEKKLRYVYNRNCQDPLKLEFEENDKELRDVGVASCEFSKNDDLYFDSESSWVGAEKNTPWWRTADTEELALLVSQRSLDLIENCDLPMPQNIHVKKNPSTNIHCLSHDEIPTVRKPGIGGHRHLYSHNSTPGCPPAGSSCRTHGMVAEDQFSSSAKKPLSIVICDPKTRDSPTHERTEMHASDDEASKAQLLEALRHSQTRAREAEKVAKQACAEKEHVIKLVFRQASQLFAYKQWLQLLQLENMHLQFKNNKNLLASAVSPVMLPWTTLKTRKMRKGWPKSSNRKRTKRARPRFDVGKYAIVFALGLGLVGAGLFLGWNIGWLLPTW